MKKLFSLLLHPLFLPLLPTAVIIAFLPFNFNRYTLEIEEMKMYDENTYIWYEDLTGNGYSERIEFKELGNMVWVIIYDHKGNLIEQWNFRGALDFVKKNYLYLSGDYNGDGLKELYLFTLSNDSIFLHAINDLNNREPFFRGRFICRVGPGKSPLPDPVLVPAEMEDLNGDGKRELIFGITAGFSLQPRNVYAYYIDQDSLVKSPESFYNLYGISQADITGNGIREIIPYGTSTANVLPETATYHDFSNWLMVLDQNLEFLYDPVEIPGKYMVFKPFVIERNGRNELFGVKFYDNSDILPIIFSFGLDGTIIYEKQLDFHILDCKVSTDRKKNQILLFYTKEGARIFNIDFHQIKNIKGPMKGGVFFPDLEKDGINEIIHIDYFGARIFVSSGDFRNMTSISGIEWTYNKTLFSLKEAPGEISLISLQLGRYHYLLRYGPNPAFYLNFLWFFLIYLGMLGFSLIARHIQRIQLQKSFEAERKIAELQLKLVKNQLDPHFVLNAINTIIHNLTNNEADKASGSLIRFSRLYRSMLLSAGSIHRTIQEELDFCMDYIELEKARFDDSFKFELNVSPGVNMDFKLPGMIIQTHVENAVKHGLSGRKSRGVLAVSVESNPAGLLIRIRDNGIGRKNASLKKSNSTGKGMELMKEYQELYNKLFGKTISHDIEDLCDEKGEPAGTLIKILISHHHEN